MLTRKRPSPTPSLSQDGETLRAERDEAAAEVVALRRRVAELEASVQAAVGECDVVDKRVAGGCSCPRDSCTLRVLVLPAFTDPFFPRAL